MREGLMMDDYPLSLTAAVTRAERFSPDREVVFRRPDGSVGRSTLGDCAQRSHRLAGALAQRGLAAGAAVATLMWNGPEHLEAYFALPAMGAVLHTLNPRLSPEELAFIVNDAEDRAIEPLAWPQTDERAAAAICYTSGTTGRPKGVVYSHRALVLHSIVLALPDVKGLSRHDTVLAVVPMFHANGWGLIYTAALLGTRLVLPGPRLDAESVLELLADERVTLSAGVPPVWMAVLQALDAEPDRWDLSALKTLVVGGAAAPQSLLEGFDRHGLFMLHAWGMTETSPLGSVSRRTPDLDDASDAERAADRVRQGIASPFIEIRARSEEGELVPWDDTAMGELEIRGPWVARGYLGGVGEEKFTDDGWFCTGDVVSIDARGSIRIRDRSKDLVKSGGEWISSVDMENRLMAHPDVAEAAVIAIPDDHWGERPLAAVVLREGHSPDADALRDYLADGYAKWQLPDRFEFLDEIPRTATGKFKKTALREMFLQPAPAPAS